VTGTGNTGKGRWKVYEQADIRAVKTIGSSAVIQIALPEQYASVIRRKDIQKLNIWIDDGRYISGEQRRKAYATLRDIAWELGYTPEELKEVMKAYFMEKTGDKYFSLSDCSMDTARKYISFILDFALENGICLSEGILDRTDDIDHALASCLKYRRCAICGQKGEIHHWDAIGMGNDRRKYDDSENRKICLCRAHHSIAHQQGGMRFAQNYHVYGIVWGGSDTDINQTNQKEEEDAAEP